MIVLRNRPSDEDQIWNGLLDILLDYLQETKTATSSESLSLFLVSPWFSNMTYPIQGRSLHMEAFGQPYSQLDLIKILKKIVGHLVENSLPHRVRVVCRPPHDLISNNVLELLEEHSGLSASLKLYLLDQAASQKGTIDLLYGLHQVDPEWSKTSVAYDDRLHAKIVCSNNFAFVGSANITYSGLYYNNEIALFIADSPGVERILKVCNDIWEHSVPLKNYRRWREEEYTLLMERLMNLGKEDVRLRELGTKIKAIHEIGQRV